MFAAIWERIHREPMSEIQVNDIKETFKRENRRKKLGENIIEELQKMRDVLKRLLPRRHLTPRVVSYAWKSDVKKLYGPDSLTKKDEELVDELAEVVHQHEQEEEKRKRIEQFESER